MSEPKSKLRKAVYAKSAYAFRWIHIYVSMLSFASLMFFAITGITLNHPAWFGAEIARNQESTGELPMKYLEPETDKLAIAEQLRESHRLRGKVAEFQINDQELMVVFKSPGYGADIFVDRSNGKYTLQESVMGTVAIINDLHKGRDSGPVWSAFIDGSAVVMMVMSVSGFGLLFYLKKRRVAGVFTALVGTVVLIAFWLLGVV